MSESTEPETVIITGASAGIGRATARAFGERGAKVGLLARGEDGLEEAKREIERSGGEAVTVPTDVAEMSQVENAAEIVTAEFGPIDVWVNCAMTTVFSEVKEMDADEYRRVTEVTYLGYVHGTMAALERMRPRDEGTIVQVGSALAYRGIPLQSAYCASKHAIKGFTESLRTELIHDDSNIDVTMVHLPGMNTTQFTWVENRLPKKPQPVPPIYQPEVAADAIIWATHHNRRELYVGKPTLKTILGEKLVPWYLDRALAKEGYAGQLTDEPADPDSESNLWEPVSGDHGAHGPFDERATQRSYQLWVTTHRKEVALLGVGCLLAGANLLWNAIQSRRANPKR
ncbi:SDR family oxidoreductase [Halopiger djelfimassiliensis]|uniref:SDR family oxidoreductase n=1 Tax=Halopiger djelfimassiliensis TaxID=1293047 RepID=UPI000677B159|nr:SDR family oxidoreductase [Halopiger djelfimassiliensis]